MSDLVSDMSDLVTQFSKQHKILASLIIKAPIRWVDNERQKWVSLETSLNVQHFGFRAWIVLKNEDFQTTDSLIAYDGKSCKNLELSRENFLMHIPVTFKFCAYFHSVEGCTDPII